MKKKLFLVAEVVLFVLLAVSLVTPFAKEIKAEKALSAAFSTEGFGTLIAANYTEFVSLTLPAGKYLIIGKGVVQNQQSTSGTASCNMMSVTTPIDTSDAALPAASIIGTGSYATLAFNAVLDLPTGGDVRIECISTGPSMPGSFRLSALTVGSLIEE